MEVLPAKRCFIPKSQAALRPKFAHCDGVRSRHGGTATVRRRAIRQFLGCSCRCMRSRDLYPDSFAQISTIQETRCTELNISEDGRMIAAAARY